MSYRKRGSDRQLQVIGEALDGLAGPVRDGSFLVTVGGGEQGSRGAQSRPRRPGGWMEQGGERSGALPAARQQAVLVLTAVEIDAVGRAEILVLAVAVGRFRGLLAVSDDVDDLRRAAVARRGPPDHPRPSRAGLRSAAGAAARESPRHFHATRAARVLLGTGRLREPGRCARRGFPLPPTPVPRRRAGPGAAGPRLSPR